MARRPHLPARSDYWLMGFEEFLLQAETGSPPPTPFPGHTGEEIPLWGSTGGSMGRRAPGHPIRTPVRTRTRGGIGSRGSSALRDQVFAPNKFRAQSRAWLLPLLIGYSRGGAGALASFGESRARGTSETLGCRKPGLSSKERVHPIGSGCFASPPTGECGTPTGRPRTGSRESRPGCCVRGGSPPVTLWGSRPHGSPWPGLAWHTAGNRGRRDWRKDRTGGEIKGKSSLCTHTQQTPRLHVPPHQAGSLGSPRAKSMGCPGTQPRSHRRAGCLRAAPADPGLPGAWRAPGRLVSSSWSLVLFAGDGDSLPRP